LSGLGACRDDPELSCTADLITQARAGDERARTELVRRYRDPLASFLHARLSPSARSLFETGDIVQEALTAALLQLERFEYRGIGSFWSYLRGIGLNLIKQEARRQALPMDGRTDSSWRSEAVASPGSTPPTTLLRKERLEAFETALERISEPARSALLLRLELGLSYQSVALDCGYPSADAARMAISRAMARLADELAAFEQ
jgi:RNA polymerase sigma-70 factor (ECF subfamily)